MRSQNQTTVAAFFQNSKIISYDFSMMKNIVALSSVTNLPMKLICCFKSWFANSIFLLKSIAINF